MNFVMLALFISTSFALTPSERWERAQALKVALPAPGSVSCMTPIATTSVFFEKVEAGHTLLIHHHNGEKWGPVHKGVITTNDLQTIEDKALQIIQMGDSYVVKYAPEECRTVGAQEFVCYHRYSNPNGEWIGSLKVLGHSFHFTSEKKQSFGQVYESYEARFSVTTNQDLPYTTSYDIPMDYAPEHCLFY